MATVSSEKNSKTNITDKKRLEDLAKQEPELIRVKKAVKVKA